MVKRSRFILVLAAWCAFSLLTAASASAALIVVGTVTYDSQVCKLIYDEEQDITWLDYTRPSADWPTQNTWAQDLSFTIGGVTYVDWRLPRVTDTTHASIPPNPVSDAQKNSSEMAYLYYNQLGGTYGSPPNFSPFQHIQTSDLYWSETPSGTQFHWFFSFLEGRQALDGSNDASFALAVHAGRVVPLPGSALLLGTGLLGLLALRGTRRKY